MNYLRYKTRILRYGTHEPLPLAAIINGLLDIHIDSVNLKSMRFVCKFNNKLDIRVTANLDPSRHFKSIMDFKSDIKVSAKSFPSRHVSTELIEKSGFSVIARVCFSSAMASRSNKLRFSMLSGMAVSKALGLAIRTLNNFIIGVKANSLPPMELLPKVNGVLGVQAKFMDQESLLKTTGLSTNKFDVNVHIIEYYPKTPMVINLVNGLQGIVSLDERDSQPMKINDASRLVLDGGLRLIAEARLCDYDPEILEYMDGNSIKDLFYCEIKT